MRTKYAISYTSTNPTKDNTFRRIEIRTGRKDLKVQARRGYYASQPSGVGLSLACETNLSTTGLRAGRSRTSTTP